jgi:hypothetical protein
MSDPGPSGSPTGAAPTGTASPADTVIAGAEAHSTVTELRNLRVDLANLGTALTAVQRGPTPGRKRTVDLLRFLGVALVTAALASCFALNREVQANQDDLVRTLHHVCEQRNQELIAFRTLMARLEGLEGQSKDVLADRRIAAYQRANAVAGPVPDCQKRYPLP